MRLNSLSLSGAEISMRFGRRGAQRLIVAKRAKPNTIVLISISIEVSDVLEC